jgi:hypothetical protein
MSRTVSVRLSGSMDKVDPVQKFNFGPTMTPAVPDQSAGQEIEQVPDQSAGQARDQVPVQGASTLDIVLPSIESFRYKIREREDRQLLQLLADREVNAIPEGASNVVPAGEVPMPQSTVEVNTTEQYDPTQPEMGPASPTNSQYVSYRIRSDGATPRYSLGEEIQENLTAGSGMVTPGNTPGNPPCNQNSQGWTRYDTSLSSSLPGCQNVISFFVFGDRTSMVDGPNGERYMVIPAWHKKLGTIVGVIVPATNCTEDVALRHVPQVDALIPTTPTDIPWIERVEPHMRCTFDGPLLCGHIADVELAFSSPH